MSFGALLRQYRQEAQLSLNALGRRAGMDPTHLSRIERGVQGTPRRTTVIKLIRAFGWSIEDDRAQRLIETSRAGASTPSAVLAAPGRPNRRPLAPTLSELKRVLLQAVELIAELEEIVAEDGTER